MRRRFPIDQIDRRVTRIFDERLLSAVMLSDFLEDDEKEKKLMKEDMDSIITIKSLPIILSEIPALFYPSREEADGDYLLGVVLDQNKPLYPFYLREEEMIKHIIILGGTGSGKTNAAFLLAMQFLDRGKPMLVFDWKRNYRDLLSIPELRDKEILVFTVGRDVCPFHFNPLIPPVGASPSVWLKKLIEIMCHAYFLGEGVIYLLSRAIDDVYGEFGVYEGSGKWPTFRDILDYLQSYEAKGRESGWHASAMRAISTLCFGEMNRILNTKNYPIQELLKRNVILELDALTSSDKVFLTEALLLWIHQYRMAEGYRESFKHVIILEEAHHILLRKMQELLGTESITDIILREIREFGECLLILDQHPSLLSKPALGNTYTTICLNLKERSDINIIAGALRLNTKEKEYLSKLEPGFAIVKLQGRFADPFLLKIPKVEINKGSVTDEELKLRMSEFYRSLERKREIKIGFRSFRHDIEIAKIKEEEEGEKPKTKRSNQRKMKSRSIKVLGKKASPGKTSVLTSKPYPGSQVKIIISDISDKALSLLKDILYHEFSSVSERYKRLGLNEYQGNKAKKELEEKGFVRTIKMPKLRGKGYWKALELTEEGRLGMRKGSLVHRYLVQQLADRFREVGLKVEVEKSIGNGKSTDIVLEGKIAVEVETGKSDFVGNVRKNIKAGFEKVIVVCETKRIKALIEKNIMSEIGEKVLITDIRELMNNDVHTYIKK